MGTPTHHRQQANRYAASIAADMSAKGAQTVFPYARPPIWLPYSNKEPEPELESALEPDSDSGGSENHDSNVVREECAKHLKRYYLSLP